MCHLAVGQLWVQEGLRRGDFKLFKVKWTADSADALTKHLARHALDEHLEAISVRRASGRAASAPQAQL